MLKKGKCVNFRSKERKTKSPFIVYADSTSVLVPEENKK